MPAMYLDAGETVPVQLAFGLAGAEIAAFPHLLQKLLLDFGGFLMLSLAAQTVLQQRQRVTVNFHNVLSFRPKVSLGFSCLS
jgi:hypothetical protein